MPYIVHNVLESLHNQRRLCKEIPHKTRQQNLQKSQIVTSHSIPQSETCHSTAAFKIDSSDEKQSEEDRKVDSRRSCVTDTRKANITRLYIEKKSRSVEKSASNPAAHCPREYNINSNVASTLLVD